MLIDNSDNDFVGVEEKDRIDKQGAIRAFEGKWVGIKSAHLITVYRLVHKPAPPVTDANSTDAKPAPVADAKSSLPQINGVVYSDAIANEGFHDDAEYTVTINDVVYRLGGIALI